LGLDEGPCHGPTRIEGGGGCTANGGTHYVPASVGKGLGFRVLFRVSGLEFT
jgi:hypothetical protein